MAILEKLLGTSRPSVSLPSSDSGCCLEVVVLHTDTKRTLEALKAAANLAQGLTARIRLVVPQVVPYPLPVNAPDVPAAFTGRRFHALVSGARIDTYVDIRLGREKREILESALRPHSMVVLGGRRRWWPNEESSLAHRLERMGHHVVFAGAK
jgi:hypothetical protein